MVGPRFLLDAILEKGVEMVRAEMERTGRCKTLYPKISTRFVAHEQPRSGRGYKSALANARAHTREDETPG